MFSTSHAGLTTLIRILVITSYACAAATSAIAGAPDIGGERGGVGFSIERPLLGNATKEQRLHASISFPARPSEFFALVSKARHQIRDGNCASAVPLLEQAVDSYGDRGDVWALLGICRFDLAEWIPAALALERALQLGTTPWDAEVGLNPNDIMIKIAASHARGGDRDSAISWLRRGLEARYDERPGIAEMAEFAGLAGDDEFEVLAGLRPKGTLSRDDEWRFDIDFLRHQVALLHVDPDHRTSAEELNAKLDQLSAAVPELSDQQIAARVDLFIAALGAGHDLFWPVVAKRGALVPFALKLYAFTDGLYIIDAYDPDMIGARIDLIGDTPAEHAYETIVDAFPGDNDMEARWMAPRHLTQPYTLEALGIIDDATSATLTVTDSAGSRRIIEPERRPYTPLSPALKAPPDAQTPLYLSRLGDKYWMQRIDDLDALYVQLNQVVDDDDETIAEFALRLAAEGADSKVRNLILDLRHSSGGNGYLLSPLLRQLVRFDASPDKDTLFVIIGRNTFSASHNLITDLDWIAQPVFVGEPSGSRPNALSESGNFVLPYSRLSGVLSSQLHQHSWPEDNRIWIAPDVPVGLSSTDFFAGRDPALEAIEDVIVAGQDNAASAQ